MIERKAYKLVIDTIKDHRIPLLIGFRRIGKTTLLKQLKSDTSDSFYMTLDDFKISSWTDEELYDYLVNLASEYKLILIDEIQIRPQWDLMMKNMFDKFVVTKRCNFIITGSSSINLLGKEMGVNRIKRIYLDTWDFDEYLELSQKPKTFANFEKFLGYGFPEYINSNKTYDEMLNEILKPVLVNDIAMAYPQTDTLALQRFVKALANLTNGEVNESALSIKTGITRVTIRKYLDILEKALIIKLIYKIDKNLHYSKKQSKKVYLNPHFHMWLIGKKFTSIDKFKGHIIEAYWLYWATSLNGWHKTFYYLKDRENKNQEIDFVSLNQDGTIKTAHEFKYSNNIKINKLFQIIKSTTKVIWCKKSSYENHIKYISILDINDN